MTPTDHREAARLDVLSGAEGEMRFALAGHLDAQTVGPAWREGRERIRRGDVSRVVVDAAGVTYCDSAGAAMLVEFDEDLRSRGGGLEIGEFPAAYRPLVDMMLEQARSGAEAEEQAGPPGFVENVGMQTVAFLQDLRLLLTALGEVVTALAWAAVHPLSVRWKDAFRVMQSAGVNAFMVTTLFVFLIGLILAYQTAGAFQQYGADVYMADMLAISILRELGPLMTAIMLTARSGSAFAAEIGTMKVNEEVDALTTMGLDPTRFLITPRIIAGVVTVPILTVFANVAGLVGGAIVWVLSLELPLALYQRQLAGSVDAGDLLGGLAKSFVFGMIIAGIGCIRGMQTRGGSVAVGESTTRAVVSGIVLIVAADLVFAVIYFYLDI